ncbi:hypothetical protein DY000_02007632 [Brassica cretica]|uniref:Uncharacterized protein n=1 Tax=Brassica cretica TaxID=69181 RepID=A0ABQ7CK83_BRACR|nr:hypothetical protein DY000_02007632 [Brassica cretica]
MTIELDHRSILEEEFRSMFTPEHRLTAKRAENQFGTCPALLEATRKLNYCSHQILQAWSSSSIDNTTCSSIDFCQPPSTQTLVPSTDTRSPLSTEDTHLPSTDIFHPTLIDTTILTSIDTEPRDMVATFILVRDDRGNLHDQEGHLRNAAVELDSKVRRTWEETETPMEKGVIQNRSTSSPEHRSTTPTESTASWKAVRIMTHEEFTAKHPHPPSPVYVRIDRHSDPTVDRHQETAIDRQPQALIDRQAPITYRVQMPKLDVARLNALRPKPKHSENPPETVRTPLDDVVDPMEVDRVPKGRTLRRRKEKVVKHLKRGG